MINYIWYQAGSLNMEKLTDLLTKALPESEEHVMTLGKYWEERGLERGRAESMQHVAEILRKEGVDKEIIIRVTGLSEEKFEPFAS